MFKKGISGNAAGRPKGSKNKAGEGLRELISGFLETQFVKVTKDFERLQPRDRVKVFIDLLQYAVPKLQSVNSSFDFEKMTDEELDYIIESLKQSINEKE